MEPQDWAVVMRILQEQVQVARAPDQRPVGAVCDGLRLSAPILMDLRKFHCSQTPAIDDFVNLAGR